MKRLLVIRHAKSDRHAPVPDRDRPLNARGRRQAPAIGRWISDNLLVVDLVLVSAATRARQTWELVADELAQQVRVEIDEAAYTFDGQDLVTLVRSLPADLGTVAVVGHNPAVEELVTALTGSTVRMVTSALALVELPDWGSTGQVSASGRPADERG